MLRVRCWLGILFDQTGSKRSSNCLSLFKQLLSRSGSFLLCGQLQTFAPYDCWCALPTKTFFVFWENKRGGEEAMIQQDLSAGGAHSRSGR